MIDKLKLRFGLHWKRPAAYIVAEFIAVLLVVAYAGYQLVEAGKWVQQQMGDAQKADSYKAKAARNESLLVACLNGAVIGRDDSGEVTACGKPVHFKLMGES